MANLNTKLDASNNIVDQCSDSNPNACYDKLLPSLSDAFIIRTKFSSSTLNSPISVKEGRYANGKRYGLHRENNN